MMNKIKAEKICRFTVVGSIYTYVMRVSGVETKFTLGEGGIQDLVNWEEYCCCHVPSSFYHGELAITKDL